MKQRGAALLEFAVALPVALTVFAGIGDFGAFFWRQTQMEESARLAAAHIGRARDAFADAGAAALEERSRSLQTQVRTESGAGNLQLTVTRHYACPAFGGGEAGLTSAPQGCAGERVYLRVAGDSAIEPVFQPLRWLGYPKSAFSRHVVRIR